MACVAERKMEIEVLVITTEGKVKVLLTFAATPLAAEAAEMGPEPGTKR